MKYIFTLIFISAITVWGQEQDKEVTLTVSGSGETQNEAKERALRNAIEQAFGAFISSRTEILNDDLVSDQITSLTSGNIKSYEILNEAQIPNSGYATTVRATVSVSKLASFVQSKGVSVEVKGGLFSTNIKQQILNEQAEINSICDMIGILHEVMQSAFDFSVLVGEPKSLDSESKNWELPITVNVICNKNIDFCRKYIIRTLSALSMNSAEVESYIASNKKVFKIQITENGPHDFYIRNQKSLIAFKNFLSNWEGYLRLYIVENGVDKFYGKGMGKINQIEGQASCDNYETISFILPNSGEMVGLFTWKDVKTLNQLEELTNYSIHSRGVISKYKNGGYVIYENDGHGLVAAAFDIGVDTRNDGSVMACEELVLNGYNDWFSLESTKGWEVKKNLSFKINSAERSWSRWQYGYQKTNYWNDNYNNTNICWKFGFYLGYSQYQDSSIYFNLVRPVRAF